METKKISKSFIAVKNLLDTFRHTIIIGTTYRHTEITGHISSIPDRHWGISALGIDSRGLLGDLFLHNISIDSVSPFCPLYLCSENKQEAIHSTTYCFHF